MKQKGGEEVASYRPEIVKVFETQRRCWPCCVGQEEAAGAGQERASETVVQSFWAR